MKLLQSFLDKMFGSNLDDFSPKDRCIIFRLSLIDATSGEQTNSMIDFAEIEKEISDFVKKKGHRKYKAKNQREKLSQEIRKNFFGGKIANEILAKSLTNLGVETRYEYKLDGISGELDLYLPDLKLAIEVKRIVQSGQIYKEIKDTVSKYPNPGGGVRIVLILFIRRILKNEGTDFFYWSIDGYRGLFQALQTGKTIPEYFEFQIESFSGEVNNIDAFIKKIRKRIEEIKP